MASWNRLQRFEEGNPILYFEVLFLEIFIVKSLAQLRLQFRS
jgi:hypothetical protein